MKKISVAIIILSLILLTVIRSNEKNTIIIYSSMEQFRNDALQDNLVEKFPHKNVRVMYIPTAKSAAKIYLEKDRSDADIVLGLETSYLNKIVDQLEDISGISNIDYIDEFKPELFDNKFLIWERQAGSFLVDTKGLSSLDLPIPNSYEDLLNPIYKDLIAMPDPKSSGTGFFFLKNLVNVMGEEKAFDFFDQLAKNIKQFSESGSGPIKLLNQGEVLIGLSLTFQSMNEINKGRNYEIIFPKEGSPYSITGVGLVKGRRNNNEVLDVFDYIVNEFIKEDKMYYSPEVIYKDQVNLIENYPQNIDYADMTGIESIDEKERLLDLWKY